MAGGYEHQPQGMDGFIKMLRDMQKQIDAQRRALAGLGIQIDSDGNLIFDGSRGDLNITGGGNLNVSGDETVSGTLNVTGDTVIGGTLSLPNGIIDNDALANPIVPTRLVASANTYALPVITNFAVGGTARATLTFTVPTGFTQALIIATANDAGHNSSGGDDFLYSFILVSGTGGSANVSPSATVPNGKYGASTVSAVNLITGLTGGATVTVASKPGTNFGAWASDVGNGTSLAGMALFLR